MKGQRHIVVAIWVGLSGACLAQARASDDLLSPHKRREVWLMSGEYLAQLEISDKKLAAAYAQYFIFDPALGAAMPPVVKAVADDWRRRGDAATPMILAMAKENSDEQLQSDILSTVGSIRSFSFDREPFVEFARELADHQLDTLQPGTCVSMSELFAAHGAVGDIDRIRRIMRAKPEIADVISPLSDLLSRRVTQAPGPRNRDKRELPTAAQELATAYHDGKQSNVSAFNVKVLETDSEAASDTRLEFTIPLLTVLVAAVGLGMWLLKRKRHA